MFEYLWRSHVKAFSRGSMVKQSPLHEKVSSGYV